MTDLLATLLTSPLFLSLALAGLVGLMLLALWIAEGADIRRFHQTYDDIAFNRWIAAPGADTAEKAGHSRHASAQALKGMPGEPAA